MEYLSKECRDGIAEELENLISVEFPKIKEALAEARAQGDLSENEGYRAARRAHSKMIGRIRYLQNILKFSRTVDTSALPRDRVTLLSRVEFTNLDTSAKMKFTIVSPHEMNLQEGRISFKSPIGAALMGHKEGDVVEAEAPAGTLHLRIDSVTPCD